LIPLVEHNGVEYNPRFSGGVRFEQSLPGLEIISLAYPAMNCWAILKHPCRDATEVHPLETAARADF